MDSIKSQLGEKVEIVLEPERRDTFPAIVLSCCYLAFEKKLPKMKLSLCFLSIPARR